MATIKPNTRLKEQLSKKEAEKVAKGVTSAKTLETLLTSLPKIDRTVVPTAIDALMEAADQYKSSLPLIDLKGRRSKPNIAEARASVAALQKQLIKAQEQLSNLPLDAKTAICQVTGAPIGKIRFDIEQIRLTVEKTLAELTARPNKVADAARNVLAYQVALVFRDILQIKPSSTSAKQLKEIKSRGGAAYDRVLQATLSAAGITNYDSGPLITAGLSMLKDSNLPQVT